MRILAGDEFGVVKCINTEKGQVESTYGEIKKNNEIRNITNLFQNNNEILAIQYPKSYHVINWSSKENFSTKEFNNEIVTSLSIKDSLSSTIVTGQLDGCLNIHLYNEQLEFLSEQKIENIIPKNLQRIRNHQDNQIFTIHKNIPFTIYDISKNKIVFKAKNLPHDELDLRVEVWDTDILNLTSSINTIYTCTAYGEIRCYDKKGKTRPVQNVKISDKKFNIMTQSACENYIITGDVIGRISLHDRRKDLKIVNTCKGSTGSIRDLNVVKKNTVVSCGLDRYLNVYNHKENEQISHIYLKNKLNCVFGYEVFEDPEESDDNEDEEDEDDEAEIEEEDDDEEAEEVGDNQDDEEDS